MKEMIAAAENEVKINLRLALMVMNLAARRDEDSAAEENNSLTTYKKKQFPLKSAMKGSGKFRGKPSGSGGKYRAGRNSGRENFMDAEGDFFDSRSHFNWELVRQNNDIALHTITPQPCMYCIDTV